ncbi:EAL domain-containing protein [uncultured Desulfuromonas sp.]|uniref:putative bifunctional diguanylate cyclase/phosphodiesterase n=1 Tax=uncultured Desulfuromonas sp. TaxID=181013 RepID=UPI002AAB68A5|nr:EAL domain-containing protein [uncultured Desulfuromonas sp.]
MQRFRSTKTLEKLSLKPVRYFLAFFVMLALLAAIVFLVNSYQTTLTEHRQRLAYLNHLEVQDTLLTLQQYESLLRIAGNRLVEAGVDRNPENGRNSIEAMKSINKGLGGFGIARPDGQLLLVSTIPPGMPLPNLLAKEESRAGYQEALARDYLVLGRTYFMPELGRWVLPMRVALRDPKTHKVHHVMIAGLALANHTTLWHHGALDKGLVTQVIRENDGYIVARNPLDIDPNRVFLQPLGDETLEALRRYRLQPDQLVELNKGHHCLVSYVEKYGLYIVTEEPLDLLYRAWLQNSLPVLGALLAVNLLCFVVFRYISNLYRRTQAQILFQATHDALTGLPNRRMVYEEISRTIADCEMTCLRFAVLFLDLDNFKRINDNFGHAIGDEALKKMAQQLSENSQCHLVGRQGGDEFIVITPQIADHRGIQKIVRNVLQSAQKTLTIDYYEINLGTSIGVGVYPDDGDNAEALLRCADLALYKSKTVKRGEFLFYSTEMNEQAQRRLLVENQLSKSLEREELTVYYQPQYQPQADQVTCCEALLRWNSPELGQVRPDEFIEVAEESGQIEALGQFVLNQALKDIRQLNLQRHLPMQVAVNISAKQLLYSPIVEQLQQALSHQSLDASLLKIEITESVLIADFETAVTVLRQIRQLGVQVALDDFGTGYSSLAYLSRLPCEEIKIDKEFVQNMLIHRDDENLVQSIIAMAKALNRRVVAEGVETLEHLEKLTLFGCDYIQGYYISPPVPLDAFSRFLDDMASARNDEDL